MIAVELSSLSKKGVCDGGLDGTRRRARHLTSALVLASHCFSSACVRSLKKITYLRRALSHYYLQPRGSVSRELTINSTKVQLLLFQIFMGGREQQQKDMITSRVSPSASLLLTPTDPFSFIRSSPKFNDKYIRL